MGQESLKKQEVARFIRVLRQHLPTLAERYKVRYLGVFGSYIHTEQKYSSDLDVLVEFYESPSLFQFVRFEHYLSELLGVKVDLVMKDALKPAIGRRILKEVVRV